LCRNSMLTPKGQEGGEEEEVVVKELVGAATTDPLVVSGC
jgi:hypothetical protein